MKHNPYRRPTARYANRRVAAAVNNPQQAERALSAAIEHAGSVLDWVASISAFDEDSDFEVDFNEYEVQVKVFDAMKALGGALRMVTGGQP